MTTTTTRTRSGWIASGALLAALTFSLVAAAKLSQSGGGTATFHATAIGMSIDGKSSDVTVSDDGTTITVKVVLANVATGMDLRDRHTRDALEVGTFPNATLTVARSALKFPAGADTSGDATGSLKLHGKTKDVIFHYTASGSSDNITVKGTSRVTLGDFGITPPSYLGITVKPDVDISVSFSAKDN